jgi:hypothetical protein
MKKKLLYLALLLVATACKKEETPAPTTNNQDDTWIQNNASVSGFVLDSLTHVPVPGIIVGPMPLVGLPVVMYDTSDADGAYHQSVYWSITHYGSNLPDNFLLKMLPDPTFTYYHTPEVIGLTGLEDGDHIPHDMYVVPYSHLNVHVTGGSGGEYLKLRDFRPGSPSGTLITLGSDVDTVITRPVLSNRTTQVELFVDGVSYSVTPHLSGYGTTGTISVNYP